MVDVRHVHMLTLEGWSVAPFITSAPPLPTEVSTSLRNVANEQFEQMDGDLLFLFLWPRESRVMILPGCGCFEEFADPRAERLTVTTFGSFASLMPAILHEQLPMAL